MQDHGCMLHEVTTPTSRPSHRSDGAGSGVRDVPLGGLDPKQLEMGQTSKHDDRQSRWTPRNAAQTQTLPDSSQRPTTDLHKLC